MKPWEQPFVRTLLEALVERAGEAYIVGGLVRDAVLGLCRQNDIDVAVRGDGYLLSEGLAAELGSAATFVPLDRGRGTGRVVLEKGAAGEVDISSFKGDSIEQDLRARDFTMNAMAVPVRDLLERGTERLIDPTGGSTDLRAGRIRACSPSAFQEDSLRVLRAYRLKALLGFEIEDGTAEMIEEALPLLAQVAGERIRDELFLILDTGNSYTVLEEMDRRQVLGELFPVLVHMKGVAQNPYHHLDVWYHSLESVRQMELLLENTGELFGELGPGVRVYADGELVTGRSKRALMKLALLFHDSGKPETAFVDEEARTRFFGHEKVSELIFRQAAERLRLAEREVRLVGEWIAGHMRPAIFTGESISKRALHRLQKNFGPDLMGLLLIFLADLGASRGPARKSGEERHTLRQVRLALETLMETAEKPQQKIVDGNDLMDALGLQPGPVVGKILDHLGELQAEGAIRTRNDALAAAADLFKQMDR